MGMNLVSDHLNDVLEKEPIQDFFKDLAKVVDHEIDFDKAAHYIDNYRSLKNAGLPYLKFFDEPEKTRMAGIIYS